MAFFQIDPSLTSSSPALVDALQQVEQRLLGWASDPQAYAALLLQVFGAEASTQAADELRASLLTTGPNLPLSAAPLPGLRGAYAPPQAGRGEQVLLDAAWLATASADQLEAVLLEELGHAIDYRLNGSADSPGDEGEIFSALLRGLTPPASAAIENDQRTIVVAGQALLVEAAADTTAPRVITGNPTSPAFAGSSIGFGLPDVGSFASPTFADIDGDGDLDAFIGNSAGNTLFFRNTGSAASPAFAGSSIGFGFPDVGTLASPTLADIDGDGDLDAFIGNSAGNTLFFRNTGSAASPAFAGSSIGFGLPDVGSYAKPTFADIDGDGDLDAFIGNRYGNTLFFRNTGTASSPAFAGSSIGFGLPDVGFFAGPSFADIDGDGDLDTFISNSGGNTLFFRNTGTGGLASTTANGTYGPDSVITITVPFSEVVFVNTTGGTPTLLLETGSTDRTATYTSGSGTKTLSFTYTVQAGDSSADLDIASTAALQLNGATIQDAAGNNAVLTLPAPGAPGSLADNAALVIDGVAPAATGVGATTADGTYGPGSVITIKVLFSEAVTVDTSGGTPTLLLETGTTDRNAIYSYGSGTNTLFFTYTVQADDTSADLDIASTTALQLNGATIRDAAGNNAVLTLSAPGTPGSLAANAALVIDGAVAPRMITGSPAFAGSSIGFGLPDVGYYSSPTFADIDGDGDLDAFIGNGDGNTLFFHNTGTSSSPAFAGESIGFGLPDVGNFATPTFADIDGDGDLDAFIGNNAGNTLFFLNTGTSSSPAFAGSSIGFGLPDVGSYAKPTFADIDGDGDLDAFIGNRDGNTLFFLNTGTASTPAFAGSSIGFGLPNVGNSASPTLADIDGDGDLDAFIGNNAGNTLFFHNTGTSSTPAFAGSSIGFGLPNVAFYARPTFADIDADGDLDAFIGNFTGNTLFFCNTGTGTGGIASTSANGTYTAGAVITITVPFSEVVFVNTTGGTPTLLLETGATDRAATYTSGSGTNTLSFTYTVQAGDSSADLDIASSAALQLNGATIQDAAGNNAVLTLPAPGNAGSLAANAALVIDGIAPAATGVGTTTANGSYATGSVITITVMFSEAVTVDTSGGTPTLLLETGTTDRTATYTSGSGTNTLSFTYTVQAGDSSPDLDYTSTTALQLNGATIRDGAGNNADLTLPSPGTPASLAANATLVIDGVAPSLLLNGSRNPAFAGSSIGFGLLTAGKARPTFADIDADGDLDAFIGAYPGNTLFFRNTGTFSSPAFAGSSIGFGLPDVGSFPSPTFADIDADGDLDAFIGEYFGNTFFFRNTGTASSAAFAASSIGFGFPDVGLYAIPTLVDIDGDGDLDAFIGNTSGNTLFFRNTGTASSPAFADSSIGFDLPDVGFHATPTFADIDGDGDLDAFIGNNTGNTLFFRNTGTASSPAFAGSSIGFGLPDVGDFPSPTFADIDGDGDLDAFIGNNDGNTLFFRNTAGGIASTTANGTYAAGSVITITVAFSEVVFVNTTGGTPTLLLETGTTDRTATYTSGSGTDTLSFTYTVQAGDTSADLDIASTTALQLNGATIQDAAGNNADLTLVAPGATGSLADNAALVIDGVAPSLVLNGSRNPAFAGSSIGFGLPNVGSKARPTFADIDGDGDLDAFIGNNDGNTLFFRNTGNASSPAFAGSSIGFGLSDVGRSASPALADIDGDGDLDAFVGDYYGNTFFFQNTGNATSPAFANASIGFGFPDVRFYATPTLADIDGDGDLDAFIGQDYGAIFFFRNTGTASSAAFAASSIGSFGLTSVGNYSSPTLVDIDGDGDLDAFVGQVYGNTYFFRNTGTPSSPAFAVPSIGFGLPDVGTYVTSPTFADIDGDGDLDAFIGNNYGDTLFFRNTAGGIVSTTANGTYAAGAVITITVAFSEVVFVNTTGGTPTLLLETGSTDRTATYTSGSGTNTLSFTYTVQAGDSSADLDIASTTALQLNGATIRDGAGNNAVLTLLTPGAPGSLAANAALVIDGIAPATTSVGTTTADGTYAAGAVITLTVAFSEVVFVNTTGGTPTLLLETGTTDRTATYTSGSGTNTLSFTYTVQAGDSSADLDIASTTALQLNGATIKDAAGNNADLTLPSPGTPASLAANAALVIDGVTDLQDNVGLIQGSIANGGYSDDSTPTLRLTLASSLPAGSTLRVFINDTYVGNAIGNGTNWRYTSSPLASGTHTFKAGIFNSAGVASFITVARSIILDLTAPTQTVSIGSVTDDSDPLQGTVAAGGRTNDTTPTFSGTLSAALGAGETLKLYNVNTFLTDAVVDNTTLTWSASPTLSTDGTYYIRALVQDAAGNQGPLSAFRSLVLDTLAPVQTVSITGNNDNVGAIQGAVANGGLTDDTTPTLSGTLSAALGSSEVVTIYRDGVAAGNATVNTTNLTWTYTLSPALNTNGTVAFTAAVVDGAGNAGPLSAARSMVLDITAPAQTASISSVTDNSNPVQGTVAAGGRTNDTTPTFSGTLSAALGAGETLKLYNVNTFLTDAVVDNTTLTWSASPTLSTDGTYYIRALVQDAAGNQGPLSAFRSLVLDTLAPVQTVSITGNNDNVGAIQGAVANGGLTDDTTPTLSGTLSAALGSSEVVTIYRDGVAAGNATVNTTNLTWTYTLSPALNTNGTVAFTAAVVDGAGNAGPLSSTRSMVLNAPISTAQKETLTGTAGADIFLLPQLSWSLLGPTSDPTYDTITGFQSTDRIQLSGITFNTRLTSSAGNAGSLTETNIATVLTSSWAVNTARAFTVTGLQGTFVALNDAQAGYQAGTDAILFLSNYNVSNTNGISLL